MLISLNELKKLVDIKITDEKLFELIGSRLVEIESVEDLSKKYKNIWIVKVEKCEKIDGTHLSLCRISCPEKSADLIQVVCGAPNVRKGMFAVWIAPGAVVPSTFGTAELFEISSRKLRGFDSNGMLAGADELSLGDDHSGIVEIDPSFAKAGDSFAEKFDLNDKIIEVENKSLTHRPDCFGLIGFAREVAGILGEKFTYDYSSLENSYNSALDSLKKETTDAPNLSVKIKDYSLCPRYEAFVFNFNSLPEKSPYLTLDDIFLYKAGMRPISPIVDLTNRIMLETGQPSHAFDYDKFVSVGNSAGNPSETPEISVRLATASERLTLLDDKEIICTPNDILITSNDIPVALAGAMGGKSTEIDANTKRIILEIASFSLYHLRKTQMAHGIFSEAITRFTKGRPATDLLPAAALSLESFPNLTGTLSSYALDSDPALYENGNYKQNVVKITTNEINALLGSTYSKNIIIETLENVGFLVENPAEETLEIIAPSWRTDIKIKEDIIEEVGRLLGYDNLPLTFPTRSFKNIKIDPVLKLKSVLRNSLANNFSANEVLTYSFISDALLQKVNLDPENSYKLINSLSPELQRFRPSLVPSLLEKFYDNLKSGYKDFTLFEINQISEKSSGLTAENVPKMENSLALVSPYDFYTLKSLLFSLLSDFSLDLTLEKIESHPYLEPLRAVELKSGSTSLGYFGELKTSVLKQFKLSAPVSSLELNLDSLLTLLETKKSVKKPVRLSRFPSVSRDVTVRVKTDFPYEKLSKNLNETLENEKLIFEFSPISIYQSENNREEKNVSFHLTFSDENKTLNSDEISAIMKKINVHLESIEAKVI